MKIVVIISPYSGNVEENVAYARACLFDSLMRDEAPFAPHLLYTQALDDDQPEHRRRGMAAGHKIMRRADLAVVYLDHGKSDGMLEDIQYARQHKIPLEERWLGRWNPVGWSSSVKTAPFVAWNGPCFTHHPTPQQPNTTGSPPLSSHRAAVAWGGQCLGTRSLHLSAGEPISTFSALAGLLITGVLSLCGHTLANA